MTTSRHNTFGCWIFYFMTAFLLLLTATEILVHFSFIKNGYVIKVDDQNFYKTVCIIGGGSLLYLYFISIFTKKISIDEINKTVIFKNRITRKIRIYNFSDLDGFADTFLTHGMPDYKTIGLVKDKIVVGYIDSFCVSNYKDMRDALSGMKCLGTFRLGTWDQIKLWY